MMKASSASRILLVCLLLGGCAWFSCTWLIGCDDKAIDASTDNSAGADEPSVVTHKWTASEPVDLTHLDLTKLDKLTEKTLALTDAQKFPDCHMLFEPEGSIEESFPLDDPATRALTLAGCNLEAYRVTDDGTRYVAYAVPADGPGWDLRLAAYGESGELAWNYRLDRSKNAKNFTANFRRSFIAPLLPRLVCAGTLWAGGTQAACVDAKTGEETWAGMMKFWAGISPQPLENALNAATLSGLTRRYPFSGVEMRFQPFEKSGGRAAYYATDGKRLFFVPSGAKMTAFDLASFEPAWHLDLPSHPSPTWEYASAELGVVLVKSEQTVYAADTDTGAPLWAATIGADEPPVAASGGKLYMLVRREAAPNLIFEIEPKSGRTNWYAKAPTGTLEIEAVEDALILRSVRAVQRVRAVQEVSDLE